MAGVVFKLAWIHATPSVPAWPEKMFLDPYWANSVLYSAWATGRGLGVTIIEVTLCGPGAGAGVT
jgi:hypothetical protein